MRLVRAAALAALLAVLVAGVAAHAGEADAPILLPPGQRPKPAATASRKVRAPAAPAALAGQAAQAEDEGDYATARDLLRLLRRKVAADADLELALALDEARCGALDSAAARLARPLLARALADTSDPSRFRDYPFDRDRLWSNGRFDGWAWIVARARAEVALAQGRWDDAAAAAVRCVALRPLAGKELLLLALAEANAGRLEPAEAHAGEAARLDPTLPEALYLRGLFAWRSGQRDEARRDMRAAVALDSTYREPALAQVRLLLPGAGADPFPTRFLTGARAAGRLTSPEGPKMEERVTPDVLVMLYGVPHPAISDSLRRGWPKPLHIALPTLVGTDGRAVLHELPWFPHGALPEALVSQLLADVPGWRFRPASRLSRPIPVWTWVEVEIPPADGTTP